MEKKLFSIGETSRIKGITRKALRFYESIDLLKPYYVDPSNRYRYYSIEQFVYMDIIKALRVINVSPIDIKTVLKSKDTGELMEFLESQKEKADQKINELKKTIRSIDGAQNIIRNSLSSVSHKGVYTREIMERSIVTLVYNNMVSSEDAIIEFPKFDRIIEKHHLINTYETGILFKSTDKGFLPSMLFSTVDIDESSEPSVTSTLPAGEYLCVCYNQENASAQTLRMSQYCDEHGLEPAIILQVELLNDVFSIDSNYFELQILA